MVPELFILISMVSLNLTCVLYKEGLTKFISFIHIGWVNNLKGQFGDKYFILANLVLNPANFGWK